LTESKFDELIASALEQYTLDELREVIEDSSLDFDTSPIFRRRMVKMLQDPLRYLANRTRPRWQKVLRTAAAVFLCMLMLFGSAMMIPSVRAFVERVVVEWFEEYVSIWYTAADADDYDESNFIRYRLTGIPEGYEENVTMSLPYKENVTYKHSTEPPIYFDYCLSSSSGGIRVDIDNHSLTEITLNNSTAYCFYPTSGKMSILIWCDDQQEYVFKLSSRLPMNMLIALAESLTEIS